MFGLGIAIFYFLLEVEQFLPDYSIGSLCTINGVNIFFNALSALIGPLKICLFRYFRGCLNILILNLKGKNSFHALHWVPGCHKWGPKNLQCPKCPFRAPENLHFLLFSGVFKNTYTQPKTEKINFAPFTGSLDAINGVKKILNALSALLGPLKVCLFRYF